MVTSAFCQHGHQAPHQGSGRVSALTWTIHMLCLQATALDFAQVAGEGSQWQVARNFSALLQLVNAGNIAVERGPWASLEHRQGSLTSAVVQGHSFRMRLLCLVPPNHHLAEFKAPSFAQAQVQSNTLHPGLACIEGQSHMFAALRTKGLQSNAYQYSTLHKAGMVQCARCSVCKLSHHHLYIKLRKGW